LIIFLFLIIQISLKEILYVIYFYCVLKNDLLFIFYKLNSIDSPILIDKDNNFASIKINSFKVS
jgi:hypothetical protein